MPAGEAGQSITREDTQHVVMSSTVSACKGTQHYFVPNIMEGTVSHKVAADVTKWRAKLSSRQTLANTERNLKLVSFFSDL